MSEAWTILSDPYSRWASPAASRFPPDFDLLVPSAKNLVLLALVENAGKGCSYDDLQAAITASGAVEGVIPKDNLRVAIQDLRTKLADTRFQLRTDRKGREAVLQLLEQDQPGTPKRAANPGRTYEVVRQLEVATAAPAQIAWNLISTRALHHSQHYVLPRSASYWTTYSAGETAARADFELTAYKILFANWVDKAAERSPKGICLLGLNVGGEGDAELSILRELLRRFETVHYLAIDLSGQLLADHAVYLNHQFGSEIQSGRLVCAVKAASFDDPARAVPAVAEVREEFGRKRPDLEAFFPDEFPIFSSYLSNYIGNRSRPECEWDTFNTIFSVFPNNRGHAFFVGFAALRPDGEVEKYPKDWFDFLVQTPRELLYNTNSLSSEQPPEAANEFRMPNCTPEDFQDKYLGTGEEGGNKQFVLQVGEYKGAGQVSGKSYRFSYVTRYGLAAENGGRHLEPGADIQLYRIVKFRPETLVDYLRGMGLEVQLNPVESKKIGTGDFEHRYQLLAAWDDGRPHPPAA